MTFPLATSPFSFKAGRYSLITCWRVLVLTGAPKSFVTRDRNPLSLCAHNEKTRGASFDATVLGPIGALWDGIRSAPTPPQGIGVVGVIGGQGFDSLFRELGCTETISGGQTMNPSTKEILGAAERTGATHIIILPNNSNIVPAAEQAASMSESEVYVIPSTSLPQGIAAMLAYNPGESIDRNLDAMRKALATVKTIEVTQAVRDSHIADRKIAEGQFMSLVDGSLMTVGDHLQTVLFETLQGLGDLTGRLATLYWGDNLLEDDVNRTATYLQEHLPQLEVEVVEGGQPLYPYVASLE